MEFDREKHDRPQTPAAQRRFLLMQLVQWLLCAVLCLLCVPYLFTFCFLWADVGWPVSLNGLWWGTMWLSLVWGLICLALFPVCFNDREAHRSGAWLQILWWIAIPVTLSLVALSHRVSLVFAILVAAALVAGLVLWQWLMRNSSTVGTLIDDRQYSVESEVSAGVECFLSVHESGFDAEVYLGDCSSLNELVQARGALHRQYREWWQQQRGRFSPYYASQQRLCRDLMWKGIPRNPELEREAGNHYVQFSREMVEAHGQTILFSLTYPQYREWCRERGCGLLHPHAFWTDLQFWQVRHGDDSAEAFLSTRQMPVRSACTADLGTAYLAWCAERKLIPAEPERWALHLRNYVARAFGELRRFFETGETEYEWRESWQSAEKLYAIYVEYCREHDHLILDFEEFQAKHEEVMAREEREAEAAAWKRLDEFFTYCMKNGKSLERGYREYVASDYSSWRLKLSLEEFCAKYQAHLGTKAELREMEQASIRRVEQARRERAAQPRSLWEEIRAFFTPGAPTGPGSPADEYAREYHRRVTQTHMRERYESGRF